MNLTGKNFIGNELSGSGSVMFYAVNPADGQNLMPSFYEATDQEIDDAAEKAELAFQKYRLISGTEKAEFLDRIGSEIMALDDQLINRCCEETGLPQARIIGERSRTVNQIKMFADLLKEGSWVDARIETAMPDRQPVPKPDIRSMHIALGPVGVFGASNFPLAFSAAGGDTVSALAAGCSVVVKAHPAHPGTCELIAGAIREAISAFGMPEGTFSMVHGISSRVGMRLVTHPSIKAIGFTGSFTGGKALFNAAVKREEPIPVYAEMGSINPVFILPRAMSEKKEEIANGLAASVTLGVGQFCTNPGIFTFNASESGSRFQNSIIDKIKKINAGTMLTSTISQAYQFGIESMSKEKGVSILARGVGEIKANEGIPYLFGVDAKNFLENEQLDEEVFGPSTLAVRSENKEDLIGVAKKMKGHLTATIHGTEEDLKEYRELISILERKTGRLIINGFPTGVEVCQAMIHGGPFPATTDSRSTSVGTASIYRFSRPVCYQNFPEKLLPDELKNNNPLNIWRLVNGNPEK